MGIMNTGIRTDRIEAVRSRVNIILEQIEESSLRVDGYVHIFGVAQACAMIAMRRGEDVELSSIAGYLHDIAAYSTGNSLEHARRGSEMARSILTGMEMFSKAEIDKICTAILLHSDKRTVHSSFDEVLKDADVMQHCMFDPGYVSKKEKDRFGKLCREFGLNTL